MKQLLCIVLLAASVLFAGCSNRAAELYDTARFEELQNNRDHAIKLYEEIERKYPGTEQAKKAGERLASLKKDGRHEP